MRVTINGKERDCEPPDPDEFWRPEPAALNIGEPRGFAISLNGVVVRRDNWTTTVVRDGDAVEIVRVVSGG